MKNASLLTIKLPARRCSLDVLRIPQADSEWTAQIGWGFDVVPGAVTYIGDVQLKLSAETDALGVTHWKNLDADVRANRPLLDELLRQRFPDTHPQLLDGVTGNSGN